MKKYYEAPLYSLEQEVKHWEAINIIEAINNRYYAIDRMEWEEKNNGISYLSKIVDLKIEINTFETELLRRDEEGVN